jgi:hypothetical protein
MKLDLTRTTNAVIVRRRENGQEIQQAESTPISKFVTQALKKAGSFAEAEANRDLIKNIKAGKPFEATDAEFKTVFNIMKKTDTETMLIFADMTREQNEDFDIVAYEAGLK